MESANFATAKQKGRRKAGLFYSRQLKSDEDQYFATTGPGPQLKR
jgi:hypothetical protein